jgi:hypothetical protein
MEVEDRVHRVARRLVMSLGTGPPEQSERNDVVQLLCRVGQTVFVVTFL